MAKRAHAATEAEARKLREMQEFIKRYVYPASSGDESWSGSPDVYIAKVPDGGIPAITLGETGTQADVPGSAECEIYHFNSGGELVVTGSGSLGPVTKTVYNIYRKAVEADAFPFIGVKRTKDGRWINDLPGEAEESETGTGTGCITSIGSLRLSEIPGYSASGKLALIVNDGCLELMPIDPCDETGTGS